MPSIATQTTESYEYDDSDAIEVMRNTRSFKSKYTKNIIVLFYNNKTSTSNDKNTMTSYNSKNERLMDSMIKQLQSAGDY